MMGKFFIFKLDDPPRRRENLKMRKWGSKKVGQKNKIKSLDFSVTLNNNNFFLYFPRGVYFFFCFNKLKKKKKMEEKERESIYIYMGLLGCQSGS